MVRIHLAALVATLVTTATCVRFSSPGPMGDRNDFSANPTYTEGSRVFIRWEDVDKDRPVSLTLNQANGSFWQPGMEYLTQSAINIQDYNWLVGTGKNLTFSNMFFFCLFYEGQTASAANSHYFNITPKAAPQPSSAPSSTSTVTLSTSTSTQTSTSTSTSTSSSTPDPSHTSQTPEPASSSMSTGAKIGIGVGIPIALIAGLSAGLFLFRRKKRYQAAVAEADAGSGDHAFHGAYAHGGYYQDRVEGPGRTPVEMGQTERVSELGGEYYGAAGAATNGSYKYGQEGEAEAEVAHELPTTPPK